MQDSILLRITYLLQSPTCITTVTVRHRHGHVIHHSAPLPALATLQYNIPMTVPTVLLTPTCIWRLKSSAVAVVREQITDVQSLDSLTHEFYGFKSTV
jgi:hypothetical protein